jgi:EpsI family protein
VLKSFFHAFHGVFNFLLAIVLLVLMGELFRKTLPGIPGRPKTDRQLAIGSRNRRPSWAPTITGAAILVFGGYIGLALQNSTGPTRTLGLETLPASVGTYHVTPLAWSDEYKDPKAQEALTRIYSTTSGIPIEVFVGYRGNGGGRDHLQSPKLILPVKWNYIWVKPAILEINQAEKLEVNWMLTQRNDTRRVVLYWYESGGQAFSGELQYRLALLKDRILNARSGVAVIRIATPIMSGETVEEAQQRLKTLVIQVYPDLSKILRR